MKAKKQKAASNDMERVAASAVPKQRGKKGGNGDNKWQLAQDTALARGNAAVVDNSIKDQLSSLAKIPGTVRSHGDPWPMESIRGKAMQAGKFD